jgi:hypothetical protein
MLYLSKLMFFLRVFFDGILSEQVISRLASSLAGCVSSL